LLIGAPALAADLPDADADGIPDVWEAKVFGTDPLKLDTDDDEYDDRTEIVNGFDPLKKGTKLKEADADKDGLSDRLELLFGTDPLARDTDNDTHLDGEEVMAAYSPTSSEPVVLQKSIKIVLSKQTLSQVVMGIPVASYAVSSGLPKTPTPVGTFKILQKDPRAWSSSAKLWMPYWMHFSGRGHGLHELPEWPSGKKEGANHLGKPASHGCVRLGVGAAKKLYDWTPIGTTVVIVKAETPVKFATVTKKP
jgi:hypothetical protein